MESNRVREITGDGGYALLAFVPHGGIVTPPPSIQCGMRETKAGLEGSGHHVLQLPIFFEASADRFKPTLQKNFNACGPGPISDISKRHHEPLNTELVKPSKDGI